MRQKIPIRGALAATAGSKSEFAHAGTNSTFIHTPNAAAWEGETPTEAVVDFVQTVANSESWGG